MENQISFMVILKVVEFISCNGCSALVEDKDKRRKDIYRCVLRYNVTWKGNHSDECPMPKNTAELLQSKVKGET